MTPNLLLARDALVEMAELLGVTVPSAPPVKSIDSAVNRFRRDFFGTIHNYFMGAGVLRAADLREIVSQSVYNAYVQGMAEGGIDKADFESDDFATIDQLTAEQTGFIDGFYKDVRAAKGNADAEAAIKERVNLWEASIAAAGQTGLNSAKANEMSVFEGDDGEESCDDCQRFKTEPHRRKWYEQHNLLPGKPGSSLKCGGWKCQHKLAAAKR